MGSVKKFVLGEACPNMSSMVPPSKRIRLTDTPCIVTMQKMLKGKEGIISLAQGIVHWAPPLAVTTAVAAALEEKDTHGYSADDGIPQLKEALLKKLREENGIEGVQLMVTQGANQAYTNAVVALMDAEDGAVLFAPYYFNHMMALQMTGGAANVAIGRVGEDFMPDVEWLEKRLAMDTSEAPRIRLVTVVNPCNPTGVMMSKQHLERISDVCARHNACLIVDNTYENFSYEEEGHPPHTCLSGDHIVNIFSFSKAYGMMGWRIGYLAYPPRLHDELMKVQDTIAICPGVPNQKAALAALSAGSPWVRERVRGLSMNRKMVIGAIEAALGKEHISGGSGAIYLLVKLPVEDDVRTVEWLSEKHKVCVIPGSACGAPGIIRVGYGNLPPDRCEEAALRLREGLSELRLKGVSVFDA